MSTALLAWVIFGGIIVLALIIFFIMMIPEMVRYFKIKSM